MNTNSIEDGLRAVYTLVADVKILLPYTEKAEFDIDRVHIWSVSDEPDTYRMIKISGPIGASSAFSGLMVVSTEDDDWYLRAGDWSQLGYTLTSRSDPEDQAVEILRDALAGAWSITAVEIDAYRNAAREAQNGIVQRSIRKAFTMERLYDRISIRTSTTSYGAGLVTSTNITVFESSAGFHAVCVISDPDDGTVIVSSVPTSKDVDVHLRKLLTTEIEEFESAVQQLAPAVTRSTIHKWIRNAAL